MADNTKLQYIVELLTQGDTAKAVNELNKLKGASDKAGAGLADVTKGAKELFAFLGGAALVRESVAKFLEAERGVNALNYALEQTGNFTPKVRDEVLALAEALGDELKVQADDVVKIMTQLVAFGANPRELRRLTEFVFDLSETMGRDTVRASRQLSQALRGNFEVFNALGIEVDKTKSATEGFYEALSKGEQIVSGRARASIQGVAGDVQGLTVTLDDAKQKLGEWTTAVLSAVANSAAALGKLTADSTVAEANALLAETHDKARQAIEREIAKMQELGTVTRREAESIRTSLALAFGEDIFDVTDRDMLTPPARKPRDLAGEERALAEAANRAGIKQFQPKAATQAGQQKNFGTPGLSEADIRQFYDELEKIDEAIVSSINEEFALRQKAEVEYRKMEDQSIEDFKNGEMLKQQLIDERLMLSLEGADREAAEIEIHHEERMRQIEATRFATAEQYDEAVALEQSLVETQRARFRDARSQASQFQAQLRQFGREATQLFATGLAHAIVSAFEEGDKAFQKFFANFMRQIAEMILQALILRMISGLFGGLGGLFAANGGQFPNRMAGGGVAEVSSPTFLPKFNVLAGEAGREVLTVLSRPRFERVNGVPAQIGMANGQRLAITSADALERGGGGLGGVIQLRVTLSPDVKAELVNSSVKGARVMVINELGQDSAISRGVKGLAT